VSLRSGLAGILQSCHLFSDFTQKTGKESRAVFSDAWLIRIPERPEAPQSASPRVEKDRNV